MTLKQRSIIFFDGYCYLCSWAVKLVLSHDREDRFRCSSLQSRESIEFFDQRDYRPDSESIVLSSQDGIYTQSEAIIRICLGVGGFWTIVGLGYLVPQHWRDLIYSFVARNRSRVFGERNECLVPPERLRSKFDITS